MRITLDELEHAYWECIQPFANAAPTDHEAKLDAVKAALGRAEYGTVLELGCGDGALAARLASRCRTYISINGIERALWAARDMGGGHNTFDDSALKRLPTADTDLIVLWEILYFLGDDGIQSLARRIKSSWPGAEILCMTSFGQAGHELQSEHVLQLFRREMGAGYDLRKVGRWHRFRIDRHAQTDAAA